MNYNLELATEMKPKKEMASEQIVFCPDVFYGQVQEVVWAPTSHNSKRTWSTSRNYLRVSNQRRPLTRFNGAYL